MSAPNRAAPQLDALTSLRGLAAWWVVLYHTRSVLEPHISADFMAFVKNGDLAVDMFFVLSGFVMYLNYSSRINRSFSSVQDFLYKRFARVYPLHFFILLCFLVYVIVFVVFTGEFPGKYTSTYFFQSLFLVQNWGVSDGLQWNVPAWSISTEFFAYLCFPALVLFLKFREWPTWFLGTALVVIALGLHLYFRVLGFNFTGGIEQTGLFRCVAQFFMGMILCVIYMRDDRQNIVKVCALLAAAAIFITMRVLEKQAPVIPLIWVTLILGFALWQRANPLVSRPLVWLGDISYATYLCHYLGFIVFKHVFVKAGEVTPLWLVMGFYLCLLIASHLLFRYIEKPAQRWLLRRRAQLQPVQA